MDAQTRQAALNDISANDLQKIRALKAESEVRFPVDSEWLIMAEFGKTFGWQAYLDAKDDKVSSAEMMSLLRASRKLEYAQMLSDAETSFIGAISAQSKKPLQTLKKLTKDLLKHTKVDK